MPYDEPMSLIHRPLGRRDRRASPAGFGSPAATSLPADAEEPPVREFRVLADVTADTPAPESPEAWARMRVTLCPDGRLRCERIQGPSPLEVHRGLVEGLEAARRFFGRSELSGELFRRILNRNVPKPINRDEGL